MKTSLVILAMVALAGSANAKVLKNTFSAAEQEKAKEQAIENGKALVYLLSDSKST